MDDIGGVLACSDCANIAVQNKGDVAKKLACFQATLKSQAPSTAKKSARDALSDVIQTKLSFFTTKDIDKYFELRNY